MSLSVQGVEYRIQVKTGQSVGVTNRLIAALSKLDTTAARVQQTLSSGGDSQLAQKIEQQAHSLEALNKTQAETVKSTREVAAAQKEASIITDRWSAGIEKLNAKWRDGASWRSGISNINASSAAAKDATANYDRWGRGLTTLNAKWKDGASWRSGIANVNAASRATKEAAVNADRWGDGLKRLSAQQSAAQNNPWTNGLANLTAQRNPNRWGVGMANLQAQQQAQANNPFQRGLAVMQQQQQAAQQAAAQRAQQFIPSLAANTQQASASMQLLAGSLSAAFSVLMLDRIFGMVKNVTLLAARVQNLQTVMLNVGHTANISAGQMYATERSMKSLGITTQVSREILTRFAQNNLKVADSLKFARIAQDAAVIAGLNSSETAERMMIAVQRLDTRMLRNLGILINLRNEYQKFAVVTGRTENTLTANEKQHIVLNAVMRAGVAIAGSYESALQDVYKQFTTLERKVEEAARAIGENFIPIFQLVVSVADSVLDAIADNTTGWADFLAVLLSGLAGVGVVGAILGIIAAMSGLALVLGTSGGIIGLFLLAGAVIGAFVGNLSSAEAATNKWREAMERKAAVDSYERTQLRDLADDIERLSNTQNRTAEQEARLANDKIEVLGLLHGKEKEALQTTKDHTVATEDYIKAARNAQRLGGRSGETDAESLARLRAQIDGNTRAAKGLQEKLRELTGGDFGKMDVLNLGKTDAAYQLATQINELRENITEAKRQMAALMDESGERALRRLGDLAAQTENIDQIALRARKSLDKAAIDSLGSGFGDLREQIALIQDLSAATLTLSQIKENTALNIAKAYKDELAQEDRINASSDTKEKKALDLTQAQEKLKLAISSLNEQEKEQIVSAKERIRVDEEAIDVADGMIESLTRRQRQAAFIKDMEARGLGTVATALINFDAATKKSAAGLAVFSNDVKKAEQRLAELQARIKAGEEVMNPGQQVAAMQKAVALAKAAYDAGVVAISDNVDTQLREAANAAHFDAAAVRELKKETTLLRLENQLLATGMEQGLVSQIVAATEASNKYTQEVDDLVAVYKKMKMELAEIQKKKAAVDPNSDTGKVLKAQEDALLAHITNMEDALRAYNERRVQQEAKTQKELTDLQNKSYNDVLDGVYKRLDDAKKKLDDLVKGRTDAINKTGESIFKQHLQMGHFGGYTPYAKGLHELYQEFSPMVQGAGSKGQIDQIAKLFRERVFRQFGAAPQKGPGAQIFNAFAARLTQEADDRQKELDKDEQMLRQQILIADNSVTQVQLLKAMVAGGKTKEEIVAALSKADAVGKANEIVDAAEQKAIAARAKQKLQNNIPLAKQAYQDALRTGDKVGIADAKDNLQEAYRNNTRRRLHKYSGSSKAVQEAEAEFLKARLDRDKLENDLNLHNRGFNKGAQGLDRNSPLSIAAGKLGKGGLDVGGLIGSGNVFGAVMGKALGGLLDAITGAQETEGKFQAEEKGKTAKTIEHIKEQQKATEETAKQAAEAKKVISDVTKKVRATLNSLGLRI